MLIRAERNVCFGPEAKEVFRLLEQHLRVANAV
jgi:hypothetical protein